MPILTHVNSTNVLVAERKFEYKIDNENLNDPNFFKVISK